MSRFILGFIACFTLAIPSHAFSFEELEKKIEASVVQGLEKLKDAVEVMEGMVKDSIAKGKFEFPEHFAQGLDKKLKEAQDYVENSYLFSKEFKGKLATKLDEMRKYIDDKITHLKTDLEASKQKASEEASPATARAEL